MKRRGDTERGPALYRLGPLTVLGCAFALGGVLGGALAGLIAGEAAQNLKDFLVDYLTAAQNGEIAAEFWPMAWEQGRFFLGACLLGVTALGTAGIPALFCVRMAMPDSARAPISTMATTYFHIFVMGFSLLWIWGRWATSPGRQSALPGR